MWMDEQIMVHPIEIKENKKQTISTHNTNEPQNHNAEWKKTGEEKNTYWMFHLYKIQE